MRGTILLVVIAFCSMVLVQAQPQIHESFERFNMTFDEQNPVLSPDGVMLVFTIGNHPQNIGGASDPGDIWFMLWNGASWTEPKHGGSVINNRAYNSSIGFSADGSMLYLLGHYGNAGATATTQGISTTVFNNGMWTKPQNISIPYFQNRSNLQSGYITPDGTVFVYSAETYGSYGVEDIYVSVKTPEGTWSEPKNLGRKINTSFQELSPSLSEDGRTLYFSSNGRKGFGSFDVYAATRLDDSWTNWSDPVNIGPDVNTEGRELFYKLYRHFDMARYTSAKNSDGYGDIKFFKSLVPSPDTIAIVSQPPPVVEAPNETALPVEIKGTKIYGRVTSTKTGELVNAKLIFEDAETTLTTQSSGSGYAIDLPSDKNYVVKIEAAGYVPEMKKLEISAYAMQELEMNFRLQPIEVGTTVTLNSVLFIQSKAELLPESYPELNEVIEFMKANPQVEIELSGHTDNRGSFRQLLTLSQQRVNKVKSYMVSKGINAKRITGKGYGGSKPIASNDTEESRALNRRVEFTIKKL
jgi:OmpA-OmpF porin, OOP family